MTSISASAAASAEPSADGPAAHRAAGPAFRGRIGSDMRSGHYPVPHRYRLSLSPSCPHCLALAITHGLLELGDTLPVTVLPAVPDAPDCGYAALRPLYEAGAHQYRGPATAPVLSDDWTGRIVSTHAPDILRDLAGRFGARGPVLYPAGADGALEVLERLGEDGINRAAQHAGRLGSDHPGYGTALATLLGALAALDRRLADRPYLLGGELTAADVQVWVTLVQLDTVHRWHLDADAVHRIAGHRRLWAYARRLAAHPAFGRPLDLDAIARRHHARCRGREAAGAAVQIVDWTTAHTPGRRITPAPR
ncbi:glutathione S-transferase C-terminal domain-containing protein [Streptomyces sp. RS10V-4]|uniref:glutathione S-transferase C-terminal domain-containing protein n=1 Tax=Streptomyces rhizoryzae TaxID=2932493 RepID=UPI002002A0A5|nr:glutathione S-transferase C-terminal domain-containing protein [Streptomyces rhizoryzae]MCK7622550.1 glutathione S-transferase C-terminal domain-containing protein [Streptomyces rhizoryzae]